MGNFILNIKIAEISLILNNRYLKKLGKWEEFPIYLGKL